MSTIAVLATIQGCLLRALRLAFGMTREITWALILGFVHGPTGAFCLTHADIGI